MDHAPRALHPRNKKDGDFFPRVWRFFLFRPTYFDDLHDDPESCALHPRGMNGTVLRYEDLHDVPDWNHARYISVQSNLDSSVGSHSSSRICIASRNRIMRATKIWTTRATSSKQERLGDFFPRVWCFFLFQPTYCTSTTCMTSRNHARYILEEGMVPVVLRLRYVMLAEERRKKTRSIFYKFQDLHFACIASLLASQELNYARYRNTYLPQRRAWQNSSSIYNIRVSFRSPDRQYHPSPIISLNNQPFKNFLSFLPPVTNFICIVFCFFVLGLIFSAKAIVQTSSRYYFFL